MALDPYVVLGLPVNASKEDAKAAYRRLAMEHHPDRTGGDDERFKTIKAAWELIDSGWKPEPSQPTYRSSFSDPVKQKTPKTSRPGTSSRTPSMPSTNGSQVVIEITQQQAFEGCVVPFRHRGIILEHIVRPGSLPTTGYFPAAGKFTFIADELVGNTKQTVFEISVVLRIISRTHSFRPDSTMHEQPTGNMEVTMKICALGLFTGGKLTTRDFLNEIVPISVSPGHDPTVSIIVPGKGYTSATGRGDLHVKLEPVFKRPSDLNSNELQQLQRLNDMVP